MTIHRWTPAARLAFILAAGLILILALAPTFAGDGAIERLTVLFIYVIMATMWNALAGYGGLVSIGNQLFFGLGAYATIRLADAGINPFAAMLLSAGIIAALSWVLSLFMLHLRAGEFAIGDREERRVNRGDPQHGGGGLKGDVSGEGEGPAGRLTTRGVEVG